MLILTKFLHRSSVGSLLGVLCWSGCPILFCWSAVCWRKLSLPGSVGRSKNNKKMHTQISRKPGCGTEVDFQTSLDFFFKFTYTQLCLSLSLLVLLHEGSKEGLTLSKSLFSSHDPSLVGGERDHAAAFSTQGGPKKKIDQFFNSKTI